MRNVFRRARDNGHNGDGQDSGGEAIRLLALTQDAGEWQTLHDIAETENWILFWAHTPELAQEVIHRYHIPIVICDRDLPGEDWRAVVGRISNLNSSVCVLLASGVADDYLWREMVHNRGFEILTKPFDPEKVVRTVRFAWTWRGWAQDHSASA